VNGGEATDTDNDTMADVVRTDYIHTTHSYLLVTLRPYILKS